MRVELTCDAIVHFDCQTKTMGTTACKLFVDDPNTEVYHGHLHTRVTMFDVGIRVTMNYAKGDWRNVEFARREARAAVLKELTPTHLVAVVALATDRGEKRGARNARQAMQKALGF